MLQCSQPSSCHQTRAECDPTIERFKALTQQSVVDPIIMVSNILSRDLVRQASLGIYGQSDELMYSKTKPPSVF